MQLSTAAANGSTHLKVSSQTGTSLGGTNTTVSLATAGLPSSSYIVTLENTSSNSSDWYIPDLLASQIRGEARPGACRCCSMVRYHELSARHSGFTFNATSTVQNAGLVMNNGDDVNADVQFHAAFAAAGAIPTRSS